MFQNVTIHKITPLVATLCNGKLHGYVLGTPKIRNDFCPLYEED